MSNSIYNISSWAASTVYAVNDIVKYQGNFYYCIVAHTSAGTFNSVNWNGTTTENGQIRPLFFWKPNYPLGSQIEPKVKTTKFGDGYEQRNPEGINNILLSLDLTFNGLNESENAAICHFLHSRAGSDYFLFTPPKPFNTLKRFKCAKWSQTLEFFGNYSVKALFEEVSA